jgi:hypothetical protein
VAVQVFIKGSAEGPQKYLNNELNIMKPEFADDETTKTGVDKVQLKLSGSIF